MSYIIVWGNSQKDPHLNVDTNFLLETYTTYEEAKVEAERMLKSNKCDGWWADYKIYREEQQKDKA